MRYTPKQYAVALFESLKEVNKAEHDKRISAFARLLVANYDRSLLPKILRHFKMLERTIDKKHSVELITAHSPAPGLVKEIISKFGENTEVQTKIDPEVLGGVKFIIDDETVIDGTWKARINQLVRRMINSQ